MFEFEKDNFLKASYNDNKVQFHTHIQNPTTDYCELQRQLRVSIFERKNFVQPESVRCYWIDDNKDKIDILDQLDYETFNLKNYNNRHIYVEPTEKTGKYDEDEAVKAIHYKVNCNKCGLNSIVGNLFRCLQCNDFDMCSKCEAMGFHAEHMMLRVPIPVRIPIDSEFFWSCPGLSLSGKRNNQITSARLIEEESTAACTSVKGKGCRGRYRGKPSGISRSSRKFAEGGVDEIFNTKNFKVEAFPKTITTSPRNTNPIQTKKQDTTNVSSRCSSERYNKSNPRGRMFIPPTTPTTPTPHHLNTPMLKNAQNFFSKFLNHMDKNPIGGSPKNIRNGLLPTPDAVNAAHKTGPKTTTHAVDLEKQFRDKATTTVTTTEIASSSASTDVEPKCGKQANSTIKTESKSEDVEVNNPKKLQSEEENDWQMVENVSYSPNASVQEHVSMSSTASNSVGSGEQEKEEPEIKKSGETPIITIAMPVPAPARAPTQAPAPVSALANKEEKCATPVFHTDACINNAIVAMMDMGFSNEGGSLTHLLEDFHGNIPEALDVLSAAQQNKK